jgi:hypothetical protein
MSEDEARRITKDEEHDEAEVEAHHAGNRHPHANDESSTEHEGDEDFEAHVRRTQHHRRIQ